NEHQIINSFFQEAGAISTIRLLQQCASSNINDVLMVNQNNITDYAEQDVVGGGIWPKVQETLGESPHRQALITRPKLSHETGSYNGRGAILMDAANGRFGALIEGAGNGGWGNQVPDSFSMSGNYANLSLGLSPSGNYSVSINPPSLSYKPLISDSFAP